MNYLNSSYSDDDQSKDKETVQWSLRRKWKNKGKWRERRRKLEARVARLREDSVSWRSFWPQSAIAGHQPPVLQSLLTPHPHPMKWPENEMDVGEIMSKFKEREMLRQCWENSAAIHVYFPCVEIVSSCHLITAPKLFWIFSPCLCANVRLSQAE